MVININTNPNYKVVLKKNCIADGSIKAFLTEYKGKKAAVVTDNNVASLYLDNVKQYVHEGGLDVFSFVFEGGEDSKSLATVEKIYDFLCQNSFTRTDIIISLGGGVVGDTVGFAAATFLRGIKYIQMPTTLLSMIDSSIGGKTAINLKAGKNLAGCFYQPDKVIIDTETLNTLKYEDWQCGIGEMIKYGAIMDEKLFKMLEMCNLNENIEELIIKCLNIKKKVVEKDTFDKSLRQILNFGHTLGHGIERHSDYKVSHGKAIGIGMTLITKWAEERCLTKVGAALRIEKLLQKFDMPVNYPLTLEELWSCATNDKKRKGNQITLALIEEIGVMRLLDIEIDKFLCKEFNLKVKPGELKGKIVAPPSKSMAHRAVFCAMLSNDSCVIKNIDLSEDITATVNAARALGKKISYNDGVLSVSGSVQKKDNITIDCNESGTTFRFILPLLAALGISATITGQQRLGERPYDILSKQLAEKGVVFNKDKGFPLNISGKLISGEYRIEGDVSSQFVSALLLALPLLEGDSKIVITSELQSRSYVDMTVDCMKSFGVKVEQTKEGFFIKGNQKYRNNSYSVEGDYSNAAFFLCGAALSGKLDVIGLNKASIQGDKQIINILQDMGADIQEIGKGYKVKASELKAVEIDARNIPDLIPVISIVMAYANGKSVIKNTQRLKLKECDRQSAIIEILTKMGADIRLVGNDIIINGGKKLNNNASFCVYNDHRIAMSLTVAALKSDEIEIIGAQAVKKSYPNYYLDYKKAGGQYVISMGK